LGWFTWLRNSSDYVTVDLSKFVHDIEGDYMAGRMMASDRNRSNHNVDSAMFDDGFWTGRKFKGKRRTGAATGGRGWRRNIRAAERVEVNREIRGDLG
jgi:hypothetical protein